MPIELRPGRPNPDATRAVTDAAPATSATPAAPVSPTAPAAPIDAPAPAPLAHAPTPSAPLSRPTNTSGLATWFGDLSRRFRPAISAVLIGATTLPGIFGANVAEARTNERRMTPTTNTVRVHTPAVPSPTRTAVVQPAALENPFKNAATPEAKLELLRVEAGKLEDAAATMTPGELQTAREALYGRYVAGGGTLGLENLAREGVAIDNVARRIVFAQPTEEINPGNVTKFALFKYFWETTGEEGMGLSRRGLDELTPEGVAKLVAYAKTHELDGSARPASLARVDADARAVVKAILAHDHYGAFIEVDARPELYKAFGIDQVSAKALESLRPVKQGDIAIPAGVSRMAPNLGMIDKESLPATMQREYRANRAFFEDTSVSVEERSLRALGLLSDYAKALWVGGERAETEAAAQGLLDVFQSFPFADVKGTGDFNGAGWSVAQSLVLGITPNLFATHFPKAAATAATTYLSMDGGMTKAMSFVDAWREARGLPKGAEAYEKGSPLGWMIGEPAGHTKHGNLDERRPFSTSGLNWGVVLFPGDAEVKHLPPTPGFELPLDVIDGFGNTIVARADRGDRIVVQDAAGNPLQVEKVIERDAAGNAVSWSATLKDATGKAVDPAEALGVVVNAFGQVKGDAKATRSLDMWWWGFCDRNTAQRLYKSKYEIPELDRDVTVIENGKKITFPKAEAQKLVDMDVPDLVPNNTMSGFRFDDEAQVVKLKDGTVLEARVKDLALEAGPGAQRLGGDAIAIFDAPKRPMLGTLELERGGQTVSVDVRYLDRLVKNADGTVTATMNGDYSGWNKEVTGKLTTDVPWAKGTREGETTVLKQTSDFAIRGAFTLELLDGSTRRVAASDVSQIVGEMQKEMRISQFMAWVSQNEGMFATDGSTGVVVSNGMRWVNRLEISQHTDDVRPEWAKDQKLKGVQGDLARVEGDKMLYVAGLYGNAGQEPNSTLFTGWIQVDKTGRILNEGFVSGEPDFGWSATGNLEWLAASSFNPHMSPELRLKLFVNGVADQAKLEKMAAAGNLPANWRDYLTPQN
ncbi:hypothetical protein L6R52_06790 [Myxococcota bacterium]|nr:hypothetical protein [Myxococcota bacterium]